MGSTGGNERLSALAEELLRLNVDVILAVNTPAAQAAKKAPPTIPIVMTRIADPVRAGLVPSLASSGGNLTGLKAAKVLGLTIPPSLLLRVHEVIE